jgi:hypothetical protein
MADVRDLRIAIIGAGMLPLTSASPQHNRI